MRVAPEILARIDPEIVACLAGTLVPHLGTGPLSVAEVRAVDADLAAQAASPARPGTGLDSITRADGTVLGVRVQPGTTDAAVLWIHGGGMFLGRAEAEDQWCRAVAEQTGATVWAVDYRLAPEHPYPAPLADCRLALQEASRRFGRVVVAGLSAGGGLAAGVALWARDHGGPPIAALHLYQPMLDDRGTSESAVALAETAVWNRPLNELGWSAYLGGRPADQYAAPARAADLSGLPPTYLDVAEWDLFRDEDTDFGDRLAAAGVPVRRFFDRGAVHGLDVIAPEAGLSRAVRSRRLDALAADLARP